MAAKVGIAHYHFPCAPNVGKAAKRSAGVVAGGPFQKDHPPAPTSSLAIVLFKPHSRARNLMAPAPSLRRAVTGHTEIELPWGDSPSGVLTGRCGVL